MGFLFMEEIAQVKIFGFQKPFMRFMPPAGKRSFLLLHGGRGSGKSQGGAYKSVAMMIQHPGIHAAITAPTDKMFLRGT